MSNIISIPLFFLINECNDIPGSLKAIALTSEEQLLLLFAGRGKFVSNSIGWIIFSQLGSEVIEVRILISCFTNAALLREREEGTPWMRTEEGFVSSVALKKMKLGIEEEGETSIRCP